MDKTIRDESRLWCDEKASGHGMMAIVGIGCVSFANNRASVEL